MSSVRSAAMIAFAGMLNFALTGCSSTLPTVNGVADASFASGQRRVATVDLLPMDMQVWTGPKVKKDPGALRSWFETNAASAVLEQLVTHGYALETAVNWDGTGVARDGTRYQAMPPNAVIQTNYALSSYGRAVHQSGGQLLQPYLPNRLGGATGADATLYVGGWAYVGDDPAPKGERIAKGVLIGLFIVAIVAVVVLSAKKGGGGAGKAASGLGHVAAHTGKAMAHVASGMARATTHAGLTLARGALHATGDVLEAMAQADYYGHSQTHIGVYGHRPAYFKQKDTPQRGRSQMYVEMTLVDNATGAALWHARQRFNANADKPNQVRSVMRRMLASVPTISR